MTDFTDSFKNPPASYRPMPLWSWNGSMTCECITEMLEDFHAHGMGGVFVHPRPGLRTEYLSEEWFRLWRFAAEECRRLGLECHIYDENSYPSGFAGGQVQSNNPHVLAKELYIQKRGDVEQAASTYRPTDETYYGIFERDACGNFSSSKRQISEATAASPLWILSQRTLPPSLWQAGYPPTDLLQPETARDFIQLTHDRYAGSVGELFGSTIKYAFSDEPSVTRSPNALPISRYLLREFRHEHGYDLESKLIELFTASKNSPATRYDYWKTVNRLFITNYVRPLHDWCEEKGLSFTGHYFETYWPEPIFQTSAMASYRWMQAPAMDLLAFQWDPDNPVDAQRYIFHIRELRSVANQFGRERIVTESCGGGGYEMGPAEFKSLEDTLLVCGVNLLNPHLCHQTLSGVRKYDWPQTFTNHSPWWDSYTFHADHVGRVAYSLSRGKEINRLLVMQPTTTGWMLRGAIQDPKWINQREQLTASQHKLCCDMNAAGIDFDFGDECILADEGEITPKGLRIGERTYSAIVFPDGMWNLSSEGINLLTDSEIPLWGWKGPMGCQTHVDGRSEKTTLPLKLFSSCEELFNAIKEQNPPRIRMENLNAPSPILWHRTENKEERFWYLVNPWTEPASVEVWLDESSLCELDTAEGILREFHAEPENGGLCFKLELPSRGHLLLKSGEEIRSEKQSILKEDLPCSFVKAVPVAENLLLLDYLDYESEDSVKIEDQFSLLVDNAHWRHLGFDQNIWNAGIQVHDSYSHFETPKRSGTLRRYRFVCSDACSQAEMDSYRIAVERPWLSTLRCNGQELTNGIRWFDREMQAFSLAGCLKPGENVVELSSESWEPTLEISPLILIGDFYLEAAERSFTLCPPQKPPLGDWTKQGMPFYAEGMIYTFDLTVSKATEALEISFPSWEGSAVEIQFDNEKKTLLHPPFISRFRGDISVGTHLLSITVRGNLKNLMGPHFDDGLPGAWTWELSPKTCPSGNHYRFSPTGLMAAPRVQTTTTQ